MLYCPQCVEAGFEPPLIPRRVVYNRSFSREEKKGHRFVVLYVRWQFKKKLAN